jgi:Cu+-exporting ATPase
LTFNIILSYRNISSGNFSVNGVIVDIVQSLLGSQEKQLIELQQLLNMDSKHIIEPGQYEVLIGNREWMRRNTVDVPHEVDSRMIDEEELGRTAVICAINGNTMDFLVSGITVILVKFQLSEIFGSVRV